MEDKGIVIRTAYNNQGWQGRCKDPLSNSMCYQCYEKRINVGAYKELEATMGVDENGFCILTAGKDGWLPIEWVQNLTPGQRTQQRQERRAGQWVVTTWVQIKAGHTDQIECAEKTLCTNYFWEHFRLGFTFSNRASPGQAAFFAFKVRKPNGVYYTLWGRSEVKELSLDRKRLFFQPFKPLPPDRWVKGLPAIQLVGEKWGLGTYRYINSDKVAYLNGLVASKNPK